VQERGTVSLKFTMMEQFAMVYLQYLMNLEICKKHCLVKTKRLLPRPAARPVSVSQRCLHQLESDPSLRVI
jgi:hypothetical protein